MSDRGRMVLLRPIYPNFHASWNDWTDKGIDAAIKHATTKQSEGGARPMEVVEVEVVRRVAVRTRVDVVEDSEAGQSDV